MRKLVFKIGEKLIKFKINDLEDVDLDKLLKIDYQNLLGEIVTFPVILNKIGILNADMESELRLSKMNLKIKESKIRADIRTELLSKGSKATINEVEDNLLVSSEYKKVQIKHFNAEKNRDYISSLYNAAKDKAEKLNKLSLSLRVGDLDEATIQKQLNNVYYKIKDNRE